MFGQILIFLKFQFSMMIWLILTSLHGCFLDEILNLYRIPIYIIAQNIRARRLILAKSSLKIKIPKKSALDHTQQLNLLFI